jgi:hypothetical protein
MGSAILSEAEAEMMEVENNMKIRSALNIVLGIICKNFSPL